MRRGRTWCGPKTGNPDLPDSPALPHNPFLTFANSLTAVSKGAVLLGLGLDCDMPIPAERCPYHVGVVLSTRFSRFSHDESQIYMDSLEHPDDAERAKEHIHWVISKGDLINPAREDGEDAGIYKEIPIIRRITRDGSKAGSLSIVMSRKDSEREIPRTYPGPEIGMYQSPISSWA